jgi:hypothetical protein
MGPLHHPFSVNKITFFLFLKFLSPLVSAYYLVGGEQENISGGEGDQRHSKLTVILFAFHFMKFRGT